MAAGCDFESMEYVDEKSVDSNLLCHICTKPLKDPVCTSCDHSFGRACITKWLDEQGKTSCPMCNTTPVTTQSLTRISGPLRNILDNIPVRCLLCEQSNLTRGNFKDHLEKLCPKAKVVCKATDIKCPWTGDREVLIEHMNTCVFEPLRPVLTILIAENHQLKSQVQQHATEIKRLAAKVSELGHAPADESESESEASEAGDSKNSILYEKEENAIFVRNIPSSVKFNDLFTFFSQIGRIKFNPSNQKSELFIFKNPNQPNTNNVKVIYTDKASADAAVAEYHCKHVQQWNTRLQVKIAYSKKKNAANQGEEASARGASAKDVPPKTHKKGQSDSNAAPGATDASQKTQKQPKKQPAASKEAGN